MVKKSPAGVFSGKFPQARFGPKEFSGHILSFLRNLAIPETGRQGPEPCGISFKGVRSSRASGRGFSPKPGH
jgi:hypothetical protein